MGITVKLQVFEGPLDLLLHLLDKNKVNIYDIPIVEITNQYLEYIAEMKKNDGEIERLEKKLSNEGFVAKAPANVIEGERAKLKKYLETREALTVALTKLK